jgi:hypothetical protein
MIANRGKKNAHGQHHLARENIKGGECMRVVKGTARVEGGVVGRSVGARRIKKSAIDRTFREAGRSEKKKIRSAGGRIFFLRKNRLPRRHVIRLHPLFDPI